MAVCVVRMYPLFEVTFCDLKGVGSPDFLKEKYIPYGCALSHCEDWSHSVFTGIVNAVAEPLV